MTGSHLDGGDRLGQRPDLIDFDQNAVGNAFLDAAFQPIGVGDEQIVADQLHSFAQAVGQQFPAVPIVFAATVLDRTNGIVVRPNLARKSTIGRRVHLLAVDRVLL